MSEIEPLKTGALPDGVIHPVGAVIRGLAFAIASTLIVFLASLALAGLWSSAVATENEGTNPAVLVFAFNTYVVAIGFVLIYCVIVPIYYAFVRKRHTVLHYNIFWIVLLLVEIALFVFNMPFRHIPLTSAILYGPFLVVTALGVWIFTRYLSRRLA